MEEIRFEEAVTLKDLLDLTEGLDPSKVVIDIDFEVPDWTWFVVKFDKNETS